jgi:uncharacterized membrane protein
MTAKGSGLANRTKAGARSFQIAVLRGLAIVLPPLVTVVIFFWICRTIQIGVLDPLNTGTRDLVAWMITDVRHESDFLPGSSKTNPVLDGVPYQRLQSGVYVRKNVYDKVARRAGEGQVPQTSFEVYAAYVELTYFRPFLMIPFFLCLFILALYVLGKFLTAGIGRMFLRLFEGIVGRIPLVRNVYSAVKQVSDFVLTERDLHSSRVVAVEYPRRGVWALAMVTGEGLDDVASVASEPVLSVFVPTSPMPMAGFTATVKRSEVVELNITMDQAIQFIVSCGVVIPRVGLEAVRGRMGREAPPVSRPGVAATPDFPQS